MRKRGNLAQSSHTKAKGPESIQHILAHTLRRYGLDRDLARYQFVLHWPEIVGVQIAKRSRPECFRNKALVVRVENSAWAQELSFYKEVIIKRLNRFVGEEDVVDDLQFYVAPLK